jgi:hypothetical protein
MEKSGFIERKIKISYREQWRLRMRGVRYFCFHMQRSLRRASGIR